MEFGGHWHDGVRLYIQCTQVTKKNPKKPQKVKVQIWGPELFKKKGHYFKNDCIYLVSLDLHPQIGDTIFNGWSWFVFISRDRHYRPFSTSVPDDREPVKDVVIIVSQCEIGLNTYLLSIEWCPRTPAIVTSWSGRQPSNMVMLPIFFKGDLWCFHKEIHQNAV